MRGRINAHKILVENPEVKRQLGRPRRRQENYIKIYLNMMGGCELDFFNMAMNISMKF